VPSIDGGLIFLSDQSSNLTVLHHTTAVAHSIGTRPLLHTILPQAITRLCLGPVRPPWLLKDVPGPISQPIIGTCADGSVYAFTLLTPEASLLLKYLENLVYWDAAARLVRIKRDETTMIVIDPERAIWHHAMTSSRSTTASLSGTTTTASTGSASALAAGNYSINADHLQRFILPGGAAALAALLMQEASEDDDEEVMLRVGNDVATRCLRFMELCETVCWRRGAANKDDDDDDADNNEDAMTMDSDDGKEKEKEDETVQLQDAVRHCVVWLRAVAGDIL
jgi:hypothetical protein